MTRFFDAMPTDAGGIDLASMLAKDGVVTNGSTAEVPQINTQVAEPTVKPDAEPAKTETVEAVIEPVLPQPEPQKPAPQPVASIEAPKPAELDWREVVKKQPEVEVYKHLGLDEKMINFVSRWKSGEDLKDYFEAITTDYSKMSPEQVMRRYYAQEFGNVSPEDFEELYKMKVVEQYKLDPDVFDEKEVRRGKLLLNYEADKIRQEFVKRQQDLLLSKPPTPETVDVEAEARAFEVERQKAIAEYRGAIEGDAFTKELLTKRMMTIGEGEDAFNYEVAQPQEYLDVLYDPAKWSSKLYDEQGVPNVKKQLLLAAIANDDATFFTNFAKHHQKLGAKKVIEPIENASPAIGAPANGDGISADPATALARHGVITSG